MHCKEISSRPTSDGDSACNSVRLSEAEIDTKVEISTSLFTASMETLSVCGMYASGDVVFETFTTDTAYVSCQCSVKRLSSSRPTSDGDSACNSTYNYPC